VIISEQIEGENYFMLIEFQLILATRRQSKVFVAGMDAPRLLIDKEQGAAGQPKESLTTYIQ
jgi:hypothetical protein